MSRAAFRQVDITRALRGATAAGMAISRCEIGADGKIVLVGFHDPMAIVDPSASPALQRWKAKHGTTEQGRGA